MSAINRVMVPTDFSKAAERAVGYAISLSETNDHLNVFLLHVTKNELSAEEEKEVESRYEELFEHFRHHKHVSYTTENVAGDLIPSILAAREKDHVDMIIMGTAADMEEDREESNASKLVLEADCPVLVIPEEFTGFRLSKIALCVDDNKIESTESLGVLSRLARKFGSEVHILNVIPEGETGSATNVNDAVLEYYLQTLECTYAFPVGSDLVKGLGEYISEHQIDMLTIFPRNHSRKSSRSEGRLTKMLTLHTDVPLLTID